MARHRSLLQKMQLHLERLPQFFKSHPVSIVTDCVRNCECLMAYKLRQGQQVCSLYSKLWGEARFKALLAGLRHKWTCHLAERTKAFVLSSTVLCMFDWDKNRISEKYVQDHYQDLDHASELREKTVVCKTCGKRLVIDMKCHNVDYCSCKTTKKVQDKKLEGIDWIPFLEREGILVWRRGEKNHQGLFEYKVFGVYDEIRADIFLKVQLDTDYRKEWDPTAVNIKVVESEPSSNSDVLYWEMQWPTFFSNRDYVFSRRYVIDRDKNVIVITNQITEHPEVPESPCRYRVKEYYCTMVIRPLTKFEEPGLEFCMTYFDNPGVSIPGPVQTWVATSAMPDFLSRLREATRKYSISDNFPFWPGSVAIPSGGVFEDFSLFLVDGHVRNDERKWPKLFKDAVFAS